MYQYDDYDRALVFERVAQFRDQVERRIKLLAVPVLSVRGFHEIKAAVDRADVDIVLMKARSIFKRSTGNFDRWLSEE